MKSFSSFWWILIVAILLVTFERIVTTAFELSDPFWTSPNWELLMVAGIVFSAVAVLATFTVSLTRKTHSEVFVRENPLSHFLFNDTRSAPLWLIVRLYVGFSFLQAGIEKLTDAGWMGGGVALKSFWTFATTVQSQGAHPAVGYNWYHDFLNFMLSNGWYSWFGPTVAWTELLLGVALILGIFTGIAAFGTAFLNFNFGMAGVAGVNPLLFVLGLLLVLAWKVSGYIGADRYLLGLLGTPWDRPGSPAREA